MSVKAMRVLKAQHGFEVGDIIRVGEVPSIEKVNPKYAQHAGMFWASKAGDFVFFSKDSVEEHVLEEVFASLDEILSQPVVYTDCGVQDSEDFFGALKENEFDMNWDKSDEFDERTKLEFFERHYCSDTWVGVGVLSIDGERVALFSQTGRKNDCNFVFLSNEAKLKAKAFVKEFINQDSWFFDDVLTQEQNLVEFLI